MWHSMVLDHDVYSNFVATYTVLYVFEDLLALSVHRFWYAPYVQEACISFGSGRNTSE